MGFYNIYRILKDMLRTLFGKHALKLFIVAILIFTIFFVYNECFALSTIPPITVDGVTFNFTNSRWSSDNSSFTGDMGNITILRLNSGSNNYTYLFTRSTYPITVLTSNSGNYTICQTKSYNNLGSNSYYIYNTITVSKSSTSVNAGLPSYRWWYLYDHSI